MRTPPDDGLLALFRATRGFMPEQEGLALHAAACEAPDGLLLEVGSYCGKSTLLLGDAARRSGRQVVTVDHHHGSEENQPGWEWHEPALVDPETGRLETLPPLRHALEAAGLEEVVTPVVGSTGQVARWWRTPVAFLFLDGNHTEPVAQHDYGAFARWLPPGGLLVVHDVFPDPADGGQAPWHVVQRATASGEFAQRSVTGSLRVLERVSGEPGSLR